MTTPADVTAGSVTSGAVASASFDGSVVNSNGAEVSATYVAPPVSAIAFRAVSGTSGNQSVHSVTVPSAVAADDVMLLFVSVNDSGVSVSVPAGWTQVGREADGTIQTVVFSRVASAGDAGTGVSVTLGGRKKADVVLVAYSGVDPSSPIDGVASAGQVGSSASHVTPELATSVDGAVIVSYWADKTSSTTSLATSFGVTRHENSMSGGGRISALLADSDGGVPAGTHGGETAVSNASAGKATMWTIALAPAYVAPPAPALSLETSVDHVTFSGPDEDLVFTYEVTNTGGVVLDGPVVVSSDLGEVTCPVIASLGVGASTTCSYTVTTDDDDVFVGSVISVGTARASFGGVPVHSNISQATSTLFVPAPALSLEASVDPVTFGGSDEDLVFSYELTNTGDVVLDGPFSVVSDLGAVTCPVIPSLGVGASTTCSQTVTTDGDDVTDGSITSTATASGSFDGSVVNSNGAEVSATYVAPPVSAIAFRAVSGTSGNQSVHSVTVPSAVAADDVMLLFVSVNDSGVSVSVPAGWTQVGREADGTIQTVVFSRVASAGDAGTGVSVTLGGRKKADVVLVAYSGVDPSSPVDGVASAGQVGSSASHVTPELATSVDGAVIVSYWADKTSSTTSLATSFGVTRHENSMSGGGRISALLADSDGGVPAGTHGGETAVSNASAGKATMWTIALTPA